MSRPDSNVYLAHARDCCTRIIRYAQHGRECFIADEMTQDAILRNLEVIGQCIKDADLPALETAFPDTPWRQIAAFRNVLAHAYLGIELSIVWDVVAHHIPSLHARLNELLDNWTP